MNASPNRPTQHSTTKPHCVAWTAMAFAILLPLTAFSQDWPSRTVKLVVAASAGTSGDILSRMIAPRLEEIWKQPVIVENRPGAGSVIGADYTVHSTDGHTFLMASPSAMLPKFTMKGLKFDPYSDLLPVYKVISYQTILGTNAQTIKKGKNLSEIVELSKSSPHGLFFGGLGKTAAWSVSMAILNKELGIKYSPVEYVNVSALNIGVIRDDVQLFVNTPSGFKAQIESGELVPLAVIDKKRYPNLPNVPTLKEAVGYKGYLPLSWAGLMAPKNTPQKVINRVSQDLATVVSDKEFKKSVETLISGNLLQSSPAAFSKELKEEADVWRDVFVSLDIKPE
jgi:tripartite-type tricarboxylate transporter receptor subunit TctC